MSSPTRPTGLLLVVSVALAAVACGGKVSGGGGSQGSQGGSSAGSGPIYGNTGVGSSGNSGSGSSTGSSGSSSSGSSGACTQGASCEETEGCGGSGPGCSFSCSCVNGTFECSGTPCPAPPPSCPVYQPYPQNSCSVPDQECGYTTDQNPCGAVNCDCQEGLWICEPTCIALDAGVALAPDAAGD